MLSRAQCLPSGVAEALDAIQQKKLLFSSRLIQNLANNARFRDALEPLNATMYNVHEKDMAAYLTEFATWVRALPSHCSLIQPCSVLVPIFPRPWPHVVGPAVGTLEAVY